MRANSLSKPYLQRSCTQKSLGKEQEPFPQGWLLTAVTGLFYNKWILSVWYNEPGTVVGPGNTAVSKIVKTLNQRRLKEENSLRALWNSLNRAPVDSRPPQGGSLAFLSHDFPLSSSWFLAHLKMMSCNDYFPRQDLWIGHFLSLCISDTTSLLYYQSYGWKDISLVSIWSLLNTMDQCISYFVRMRGVGLPLVCQILSLDIHLGSRWTGTSHTLIPSAQKILLS
jgi:hypothetical protein